MGILLHTAFPPPHILNFLLKFCRLFRQLLQRQVVFRVKCLPQVDFPLKFQVLLIELDLPAVQFVNRLVVSLVVAFRQLFAPSRIFPRHLVDQPVNQRLVVFRHIVKRGLIILLLIACQFLVGQICKSRHFRIPLPARSLAKRQGISAFYPAHRVLHRQRMLQQVLILEQAHFAVILRQTQLLRQLFTPHYSAFARIGNFHVLVHILGKIHAADGIGDFPRPLVILVIIGGVLAVLLAVRLGIPDSIINISAGKIPHPHIPRSVGNQRHFFVKIFFFVAERIYLPSFDGIGIKTKTRTVFFKNRNISCFQIFVAQINQRCHIGGNFVVHLGFVRLLRRKRIFIYPLAAIVPMFLLMHQNRHTAAPRIKAVFALNIINRKCIVPR